MELLRHFFRFDGRINRAWLWFVTIAGAILGKILDTLAPLAERMLGTIAGSIVYFGLSLALVVSATSFQARRFHDRDKTAWWLLACWMPALFLGESLLILAEVTSTDVPSRIVPYFHWAAIPLFAIWLWFCIQLFFLRGTDGPNRYGPDPLASTRMNLALQPYRD